MNDKQEHMARAELAELRARNREYRGLLVRQLLEWEIWGRAEYDKAIGRLVSGDPMLRYDLVREWVSRGRPSSDWRDYAKLEEELRAQGEEFE